MFLPSFESVFRYCSRSVKPRTIKLITLLVYLIENTLLKRRYKRRSVEYSVLTISISAGFDFLSHWSATMFIKEMSMVSATLFVKVSTISRGKVLLSMLEQSLIELTVGLI